MTQDKIQEASEGQKKQNPPVNFTRRTFLKGTGAACVLLGMGSLGKVVQGKELLRPPGGQDEVSFIAKCLKCDRCRSVCPTSVIGTANLSDGILEARTPKMNFHLGYCDFCNKCVEVCPTEALEPFQLKTVTIGLAKVKKDICIAWDRGGCTVCADECPYKAISLDEQNHPIVDVQKCNGCGKCEFACPALKLRSYIGGKVRGIVVILPSHSNNLSAASFLRSFLDSGGEFV